MKFAVKLPLLRERIIKELTPLVSGDYLLLEVPHHSNIGDYLIWQGECDFLKGLPYKSLGTYSSGTFKFPSLPKSAVLLMNGGGSFGDVWLPSLDFKMKVLNCYRNNKVVFFPQSIQFNDKILEASVFRALADNANVYVCVRDRYSYEMLAPVLKDRVRLVPDMAFCVSQIKPADKGTSDLLVLRDDRESKESPSLRKVAVDECVRSIDWAKQINRHPLFMLFKFCDHFSNWFGGVVDRLADDFMRPFMIRCGAKMVGSARRVYTTRMHAGLLALMTGKEVSFFDNSYGKIGRFIGTWLSDCEDVSMLR